MAFSQAFNNTFRSLDNARQWRSAEKESARQFDARLGEQQRVNDSRIDLNDAQVGRIQAVTKLVDQEVDFNTEANPERLEGLKLDNQGRELTNAGRELENTGRSLLNTNRQLQNDAATLTNKENLQTSEQRVAATNAQNDLIRFDAATKKFKGQAANASEVLNSLVREDGSRPSPEEIASNPKLAARVVATLSASSHITGEGFGEDSIAVPIPKMENGKLIGYIMAEESSPGGPLRPDPDAMDADGQPRIIPVEEASQIIAALMEKVDQKASLGAQGGSARDNLVRGQARDQALATADPAPTALPVADAYQGRPMEDIVAEGDALEAQLADLQAQREQLSAARQSQPGRVLGRNGSNGIMGGTGVELPSVQTEAETAQLAELDRQEAEIKAQLGEIGTNLQARTKNESLPQRQGQWQAGVDQVTRRLGDQVRRSETLNGTNFTSDQTRNLMATGRTDKSAADVRTDFEGQVADASKLVAETAVSVYKDRKTGKVSTEQLKVAGQQMQAQLENLAYSRPMWKELVKPKNQGLLRKISLNAVALAGETGEPNLQLAQQLFAVGVESNQLGRAMRSALAMSNPTGEPMSPEAQANIGRAVAQAMLENPDLSADAAAQRAVLNIQNQG